MQTKQVDGELTLQILVAEKMECGHFALYVNPLQHCML